MIIPMTNAEIKDYIAKTGGVLQDVLTTGTGRVQQNISLTDAGEEVLQEVWITGTGEVLHDVSATGKEKPWARKKEETLKIVDLFRLARIYDPSIITDGRLYAMELCGYTLKFSIHEDGSRHLKSGHFCHNRLCPMCTWRKSLKMFFQTDKVISAILNDKPTERFLFMTLTIRNVQGSQLPSALDTLNQAYKTLFKARDIKKRHIDGYMKAMEITYNSQTDTYHPHIHLILAVPSTYFKAGNYIKQSEWRDMWQKALHVDYAPQLNIKAIKLSTSKAVAEVAKYPIKMDSILSIKDKTKAAKALAVLQSSSRNRRFVTFGGIFAKYRRMLKQDDIETGDLVHVEGNTTTTKALAEVFYHYDIRQGLYIC